MEASNYSEATTSSKDAINSNNELNDSFDPKYAACVCGWECKIRGCKSHCKQVVIDINKGSRVFDVPGFKNAHDGVGDVLISTHLWGYYVRPEMCPNQETNCYIYHIATRHTGAGCEKEIYGGGRCKFRCEGCSRVIMPNSAFINHSKNHPKDNPIQRIQWKKMKNQEKLMGKYNKQIQYQNEQIKNLRQQLDDIQKKSNGENDIIDDEFNKKK